MKTTLYADVLLLVNFSMDFISLWASAMLCGRERRALRMSAAALIGALYGVVSVILSVGGIWVYILAALVSLVMCLVAFGKNGGIGALVRQSALVWGCGALLGGIMTALLSLGGTSYTYAGTKTGGGFLALAVPAAGAAYVIARLIASRRGVKSTSLTVTHSKNSVSFTALCDSGNLLADPVSGIPCVLVSEKICGQLIGKRLTSALICADADILADSTLRFRFIPRKNSEGAALTAAFMPDSATLGKKKEKVRVLLLPAQCGDNYFGGFPATLPASLAAK